MNVIDKLAWIEIQGRRLLSTRSKGKSVYYIPGGKREVGETDEQTLLREIEEELTVRLHPHTLAFMGMYQAQAHGHPAGVQVQMRCYTASYSGTIRANSEIEEVVWLSYRHIGQVSPVDKLIFEWLKQQDLID